jgi:DNA-binding LacI/PurR family transcriptional regulator
VKKPTIRDVAKEAGVSVATVSRVLNNKPDTSGVTRKKVEDAISRLGYARSAQWEQLITGKSRTISLHFPHADVDPNPVYLAFISGATAACESRDYRLHLITRTIDEADLIDLYRSKKSDGTILMRVQLDDWRVDFLSRMQFPFVTIGRTEKDVRTSSIDYDMEAAVRLGLDHLVALGHRGIGFLSVIPSGQSQHGSTVRAVRAYREACQTLGLPVLDFEVDQNLQSVRLVTTRVLKEHPEITGLMTIREMVETAIYSAASDAGLSIPDELSVVGLTNAQGLELTNPPLTALDFPAWSMAHEAGRMLIDRLEDVDTSIKQVLKEPTLSVRGSTGPVRQGA